VAICREGFGTLRRNQKITHIGKILSGYEAVHRRSLAICALAGWLLDVAVVELRAVGATLQARNAAALSEQVDFARLRSSLAQQIIAAYLRLPAARES
jgi:hypothetical protein